MARRKLETTDEQAERDVEREAIQTESSFFDKCVAADKEAGPAATNVVNKVCLQDSTGDVIEVTRGEEMYGVPGSFCTYRVGPFKAVARVLPGETIVSATKRVADELALVAATERERCELEFGEHRSKYKYAAKG